MRLPMLRDIRTDIGDVADIMSSPPAWRRVCSGERERWKSELKGTWQFHFFLLLLCIFCHFEILDVSEDRQKGARRLRWGDDGVCGSKPTQFQFQHISPNDILWSSVRDYSCLILTNAAE